jgi:hypothetical protein
MVKIELDTDPNKSVNINVQQFQNIEKLIQKLQVEFGLEGADERTFGLKNKKDGLLM